MTRLFGTDGIRGVANKDLTPEFAFRLGIALCENIKKISESPTFLIGYDTRISSLLIHNAITAGIMSCGGNITSVGVITTPAIAYLTKSRKLDCGIVISASHNPYYDNGIKFFNSKGMKLSDEIEDSIQDALEKGIFDRKTDSEIGKLYYDFELSANEYVDHLLEVMPTTDLAGLKIAMDCANGASSFVAPRIFNSLGGELHILNNNPDGININKDCGSTHLENLCSYVKENNCDFGLAFDGDADRLMACDEYGNEVNGDMLMYLFSLYFKNNGRLKNNTIALTVMSNLGLKEILHKNNIKTVETQVGDRYLIQKMLENNYILGGEQSGHIIMYDYNPTGDGIAASMLLSYLIKTNNKSLSDLLKDYFSYPQVLLNINTTNEKKTIYIGNQEINDAVDKLKKSYGENGRILLRHSGTEPLIRIMIEGKNIERISEDANYLRDIIVKYL